MSATNVEKLFEILNEELKIDNTSLETSQENTPSWDSMTYLSIAARIENEFDFEITPENITSLNSVKNILALLN